MLTDVLRNLGRAFNDFARHWFGPWAWFSSPRVDRYPRGRRFRQRWENAALVAPSPFLHVVITEAGDEVHYAGTLSDDELLLLADGWPPLLLLPDRIIYYRPAPPAIPAGLLDDMADPHWITIRRHCR